MTAAEKNKMLNDMKNAITLETDIAAQHQLMECCGKTMQEKCPVFVPLEKPVQRAQSVFVDSPNEMHLILAWIMALLFGGAGLFCFSIDDISVAVVLFLICLGGAVGIWFGFASTYLEQKKAFSAYIEQLEKDQAKMKEWKAANQKKEEAHKRQYRDSIQAGDSPIHPSADAKIDCTAGRFLCAGKFSVRQIPYAARADQHIRILSHGPMR